METKPSNKIARKAIGNDDDRALPKAAPKILQAEGRKAYHRLRNDCEHLRDSDYDLIVAYCCSVDRHHDATVHLQVEGAVVEGAQGVLKVNPWELVATKAAASMAVMSTKIGLAKSQRIARGDSKDPKAKVKAQKTAKVSGIKLVG